MKFVVCAVAAAAVLGLPGCASNAPDVRQPGMAASAAADQSFAVTAAGMDMYEIQASQLALARASAPAVRSYAQMLVDHHTATSNELKAIVAAKGVTPAASLPVDLAVKIAQLQRLKGADFDREYIRMTGVNDHQAAIAVFETASRSVADPDLRNFAVKGLPILRQHLKAAQDIAGTLAG